MSRTSRGSQRGVVEKPIEFRMRFAEVLERAAREVRDPTVDVAQAVGPYITISRSYGSGGADIAEAVARELGWSLLDRRLVEELAERIKVSPHTVELVDETRSNWFRDTLLNLMEPRLAIEDNYLAQMAKVVCLAGYDGRVVVVGRGGNFILPRDSGLAVRVDAPERFRVARLQERELLDERSAERTMRDTDAARADFIHRYFGHDVTNPTLYDLVLDASVFGIDGAAELVCRAAELKGLLARR